MLQDKINRVIEICGGWGLYEPGASTSQKQMMYASTELAEFTKHFLEGKTDMLSDDIGDILVCIINAKKLEGISNSASYYYEFDSKDINYSIGYAGLLISQAIATGNLNLFDEEDFFATIGDLASLFNLTLEECLDQAISVIEKRKGKIINGVFIKEA